MRKLFIVIWCLFVLATIWVWLAWPSETPELIMCDVGQGDGMIITQGFSQMVIDVGPANGAFVECLGSVLPFWDKRIEMVVITHADSDHVGGLSELSRSYKLDRVVTSEKAIDEVRKLVPSENMVAIGLMGQKWHWGKVMARIVWPPALEAISPSLVDSTNDTSLVLRLLFQGGDSAWLAADTSEAVEEQLLKMNLVEPTTTLKVSHHGSKYATSEPFLAILQPRYFVVSVGKNNYGHPSEEVLKRVEAKRGIVKRTDKQGAIRWRPGSILY